MISIGSDLKYSKSNNQTAKSIELEINILFIDQHWYLCIPICTRGPENSGVASAFPVSSGFTSYEGSKINIQIS